MNLVMRLYYIIQIIETVGIQSVDVWKHVYVGLVPRKVVVEVSYVYTELFRESETLLGLKRR